MSTKQFKMYLEDELVERLERVAERNGRRSAQQVAEEILLTYLPVWTAVSDAMARAVTYQSTHEERKPERHLAPVVARIAPANERRDAQRMIDEADTALKTGMPLSKTGSAITADKMTTKHKRRTG